jgi:hypothetical protein
MVAQAGSMGQPAYANDVVYVLAAGTVLEARSGATGALLWTSNLVAGPCDGTMFETMIVTGNLAFVGTREYTPAIDLKTHQTVWIHALGGAMSISDRGVLSILSQSGAMAAINKRSAGSLPVADCGLFNAGPAVPAWKDRASAHGCGFDGSKGSMRTFGKGKPFASRYLARFDGR